MTADIEDGKVVKGINGLTDQVEIVAGEGVSVTESDNGRLVISAHTGLEGAFLDTNLHHGISGDDGDPEPFIVYNEILRATPSNSFHEMGTNGGLTVENTAAGAANINFIRSSGGVDQSYYRFVNRANGDFNIRDVQNSKSPFKMAFNAQEDQLVLGGDGLLGFGKQAQVFEVEVAGNIHASGDVRAFDDLIVGRLVGEGDISVFHNGAEVIRLDGLDDSPFENGGLIELRDETGGNIGLELAVRSNHTGRFQVNDENDNALASVHAIAGPGGLFIFDEDSRILNTIQGIGLFRTW